jgi:hypothetical protein
MFSQTMYLLHEMRPLKIKSDIKIVRYMSLRYEFVTFMNLLLQLLFFIFFEAEWSRNDNYEH